MKIFFVVVSVAIFVIPEGTVVSCDGRVRRQLWPAPGNPFWGPNGGQTPDFYSNEDLWPGPPRFDQPPRSENNFWDNFDSGRRNDWNQGGGMNDWNQNGGRNEWNQNGGRNDWNQNGGRNDWNQNGGRNDWNQNGGRNDGNNGNQGRRTTTENLGPITSTPSTIHTAPEGCQCLMTQQFNPVCGTDGNTYRNIGLMNCYRRCGTNVSQKRLGRC